MAMAEGTKYAKTHFFDYPIRKGYKVALSS